MFCTATVQLLFTATATPYLHNGIVAPDEGDADNYDVSVGRTEGDSSNLLVLQFGDGKVGIISRNEIGLLMWDTDEVTTEKINIGSRLKATDDHITGLGCASHPLQPTHP